MFNLVHDNELIDLISSNVSDEHNMYKYGSKRLYLEFGAPKIANT